VAVDITTLQELQTQVAVALVVVLILAHIQELLEVLELLLFHIQDLHNVLLVEL
jgi:hypothetical protein